MADITKISLSGTSYDIKDAGAARASTTYTKTEVDTALAAKQASLVSGTNIKTVNNESLLGSGNITIQGDKGDKGDTGNVTLTDGDLDSLTIYNGLDYSTNDSNAVLSAYQGYVLGQAMGKVKNTKDNTYYRLWIGTQTELDALTTIEDDVIYLTGIIPTVRTISSTLTHASLSNAATSILDGKAYSATVSADSGYTVKTITVTMGGTDITSTAVSGTSISIAAVTGNIAITAVANIPLTGITLSNPSHSGNAITLSATLTPSNTTETTVSWSIDNTTDFSLSSSGLNATLTVLSTASTASVNVTCTSTSDPTKTATKAITGIDYVNIVPITAVNSVSYAAGQATNTYQFTADVSPTGGNSPAIVWSVVPTPSGAATINSSSGLLTITESCSVVVTATSGENSASSSSISLTWQQDPNAPIVWEDSTMESFMLSKVTHANNGYITYGEAATYTNDTFGALSTAASYPFANIKSLVTKFNEWQYFPGLTAVNLTDFTALTEVTMPSTVTTVRNHGGYTILRGTAMTSIVFPEGFTTFWPSGVSGDNIESISFPSSMTAFSFDSSHNTLSCPNLKKLDISGTSVTSIVGNGIIKASAVEIFKLPHTLTSFGSSSTSMQMTRYMGQLTYASFGDSTNGSSLDDLYLGTYNGHNVSLVFYGSTPPTNISLGTASYYTAVYVPDASISAYQSAMSAVSSKIKGLSELPSGWDTPSSNS